jgi:hypothetical protein
MITMQDLRAHYRSTDEANCSFHSNSWQEHK